MFISIINLNLMFKLKLNKFNVQYVQMIKNKNLSKLLVGIIFVYNVVKNYIKIINIIIVQYVNSKIGL